MLDRQLLDLAFDAALWRILQKDVRAQEDILAKFRLARHPHHRVHVDARLTWLSDRMVAHCCRYRGDDISFLNGSVDRRALLGREAETSEMRMHFRVAEASIS